MTCYYRLRHGAIGSIVAESEEQAFFRLRRVWGDDLLMVVQVWTDCGKILLDRSMLNP